MVIRILSKVIKLFEPPGEILSLSNLNCKSRLQDKNVLTVLNVVRRLHKRTESKKSRVSDKAGSPCLNGSIAKSVEIKDISHRKEDSDRVEVAEEVIYSRLHKPHPETALNEEIHDLCHVQASHHDVLEQSNRSNFQREYSPTFLEDNRELGGKLIKEKEISDITVEVNSNSVGNINASDSRNDHYSTNTCDSVHVSSIPEIRLDHSRDDSNKELIPQEIYQSRSYYGLPPIKNSENVNNVSAAVIKSSSCLEKLLEPDKQDSNEGKCDHYEYASKAEEDESSVRVKSPKSLYFTKIDRTLSKSPDTQRSDEEYKKCDSTSSSTLAKYLLENEADKFDRFVSNSMKSSTDDGFGDMNFVKENLNIKCNEENDFRCRSTVLNHQNDLIIKNDLYIVNVGNSETKSEEPEIIADTCTTDVDLRILPSKESNKNFSIIATNNYGDATARNNLDDSSDAMLKQQTEEDETLNATLRSHKSRKKSLNDKKPGSFGLKEEFEAAMEQKTADSAIAPASKTRSKAGKTKNRSTRNQKRDRQKIAAAEIGVADDDSGIQGDIYEFSEKESNLEDIRIPSIMRRTKQEARQTSVLTSHLQEMHYNDDCNKTEPPVLIPQEPWPPAGCNQNQSVDSDVSSHSRENSVDSESLKR